MTPKSDELHFLIELALDRSTAGRRKLATHVSDLCSAERQVLTEQEADLISEILKKLLKEFEQPVRKMLSERLAESRNAPHDLIVTLAKDEIEIAAPVLMKSELLKDTDLIEIIRDRGRQHRLTIANRRRLGAEVSDALVETGDEDVIKQLLENQEARISEATMAYLVEESRRVDSFQEPLVNRHDLPVELAKKLYWWVAAALRLKILENFDIHPSDLDGAMEATVNALHEEEEGEAADARIHSPPRELAKAIVKREKVTGDYLIKVLRRGEIPLFEALFSELSGLESPHLQRILYDNGGENLAVAAKALKLPKQIFATIFMLTRGNGGTVKPRELSRATKVFDSVSLENASEILQTWQRDSGYQDATERLWAGARTTGG